MFRRIFRAITNIFRRQKNDDDKESEIEGFSFLWDQEPENIPDFQVFPSHTAVSTIVNASMKPLEEPIETEAKKAIDIDKVVEFGLQEIQFIPQQEPETIPDSQKIWKEKKSKVTVYVVTIFLEPDARPDKEKLENEGDSEKEKILEGNREEEADSQKICENKKETFDVDSGLQCPLDSAIVDTPLDPDNAKDEISVQQSSWTSIEDYDLNSVIGKGGFGKIYLAKHKQSKETVAIKALKKEGVFSVADANRIHLEKNILELVAKEQNPFIVGLFASFQTEHHLCFVMDYCAGGDLLDYLDHPFPLEKAVFCAGCIVLGLQFLHKNNIIHRDIKPENVLIASDGYLKITDFGLSKKTKTFGGVAWTICGTRYYMAPELIECDRHTKAVDWWALGIMIYEMLLNTPPFTGPNARIDARIKRDEPMYPVMMHDDAINILKGLLTKDPKTRLGASDRDAEEVMESSFFKQLDFDALSKKKITPPLIPKKKNQGMFSRIFRKFRKPIKLSKSQYKQTPKLVERKFKDFDCCML